MNSIYNFCKLFLIGGLPVFASLFIETYPLAKLTSYVVLSIAVLTLIFFLFFINRELEPLADFEKIRSERRRLSDDDSYEADLLEDREYIRYQVDED